jgi:hypothetical protein
VNRQPFEVPSDAEVWERSGAEPTRIEGEERWIKRLRITADDGRQLTFSYDPVAGSVVLLVEEDSRQLICIEREYAVRLLVTDEQPPRIRVEFRSGDTRGELAVRWSPRIEIDDWTLAG